MANRFMTHNEALAEIGAPLLRLYAVAVDAAAPGTPVRGPGMTEVIASPEMSKRLRELADECEALPR